MAVTAATGRSCHGSEYGGGGTDGGGGTPGATVDTAVASGAGVGTSAAAACRDDAAATNQTPHATNTTRPRFTSIGTIVSSTSHARTVRVSHRSSLGQSLASGPSRSVHVAGVVPSLGV